MAYKPTDDPVELERRRALKKAARRRYRFEHPGYEAAKAKAYRDEHPGYNAAACRAWRDERFRERERYDEI